MRILHLDSGREMRGGQWQVLRLLEGLRAAGCDGVLLSRKGSPLYERAGGASVDVQPWNGLATHRVSRQCDLTHAHDARSHTLAALWARGATVVSRRVAFPVASGILSRWKYGRVARFLAVSEAVRAALRRAGVDDSRIAVVPDGVEVPDIPGYRADGPIVAIDSTDPLKHKDLAAAAAKAAGVKVEFSSDLAVSLRSARCFLYVTEQEGLGSAALMAMAAGVPVIASRVGGLPEVVRDGETGLLASNTVEAIAGALRRLEQEPALGERLGARGRAVVQDAFTVGHMAARTMSVYRQVTECQKL